MDRRNSKCPTPASAHDSNTYNSSSSSSSNLSVVDMNRNKRKSVVRGTDDANEFSQQSILSAMDRFVSAVNNMDDTIMVPSRLMDMGYPTDELSRKGPPPTTKDIRDNNRDVHRDSRAGTPPALNAAPDLFGFYNMLNTVKNELIWGPGEGIVNGSSGTNGTSGKNAQLARRMSTVSVHSYSDSDVESESSTEFDSGVDVDEQSVQVATAFRQHLSGLFQALHQLTDAANYLATRYQEEVDGAS